MKGKWKDARGETLIEVLASILIATLSVTLLFGAAMTSSRLDRDAKKVVDESYYNSLYAAENRVSTGKDGSTPVTPSVTGAKVTVKNNDAGVTATAEPAVTFYGGADVFSFALQK